MLNVIPKTNLKTLLAAVLIVVVSFVMLAMPANAATPKESVCEGIGLTAGTAGSTDCASPPGSASIDSVIVAIINIVSVAVGVIAVIMIIIGGLKYIMSSGDSNNISSAKNTILYAIIGLVIVAFAQIIVRYVITKATQ